MQPDPWQVEALNALGKHGRVTITACHGPGKDALAAWAVLWVMYCFPHPKVPCTAPTKHQLSDLLWAEIAKWYGRIHPAFRRLYELKSDRFERRAHKDTWFAVGRTARKENPEALQGFHADTILVVVDEASGVPSIIFEVLEGAMTGPRPMMLLIGNPTQTAGYFYDSHHSDRGRWHAMRVMAEAAHDGGELGQNVYLSGRVSPEYVHAMGRKYGKDSNVYRVRVLGLFPKSEDDQTIPLEWVEAARGRELPANHVNRYPIVAAVDVARFGDDDSAMVVRKGPEVLHVETWHGHSITESEAKIVGICKRLNERGIKPGVVFVDGVGVGAGLIDVLYANGELRANSISVLDVQAGESSPDDECERMRDALWWRARKEFDPKLGSGIVFSSKIDREECERLTGELASPKFAYTTRGKIKVESKKDMKERGIGSPDVADAFVMTYRYDLKPPQQQTDIQRLFGDRAKKGTWMSK